MIYHSTESGSQAPWLDADDIKARVSIEAVLTRYGILDRLKRKGERLVGLSPFRDEKSPSFSVDTQKNIWNDFGGKPDVPGNVIGLVQALENCSFREALVILHREFIKEAVSTQKKTELQQSEDPAPEPAENHPFGKELKGLFMSLDILVYEFG